MKKELLSLGMFLFISVAAYGQMGINTPSPNATLDIVAKKTTGTSTDVDGLLIPRVDRERAQSMDVVEVSTLIYVNDISTGTQTDKAVNIDVEGYYYFNGKEWVKSDKDANLYNSNGTLTGNRIVSQGANTLAFRGTAANAFSVDGNTFSVDAANHRVGIGTAAPLSILSVLNSRAGNLVDAFIAGINNCGSPCGQGTARNIVLYNENDTNSKFAGIDFVAAQDPKAASGASIYGIDRDIANNYAGLSFATRNATGFGARLTIKSAGNVGVGTETPNGSAALEVSSTTKGFLPPRLTTVQRDAINPKPAGLIIYNTTINCMQYWNATTWAGNCNGEEAGTVVSLTCSSAVFSPATLTQGTYYTGTLRVPYTGGNGGTYSQISFIQNGLTFTLPAGTLISGDGNLEYTVSGTPLTAGAMSIPISFGGTSCNVSTTIAAGAATVVSLTCNSAAFLPATLTQGAAYTGTLTVPYTGGNGGTYSQTSFIHNDLTFTLPSGTLANNGNLVYTVSGTPSASGVMNVPIAFGGQSCSVTTTVSGISTVVLPGNSEAWMRHNLGANYSLDPDSPIVEGLHGNYYQWGIPAAVANTSTPPGVIGGWNNTSAPDGAWQDTTKTANDPCPSGFRVPTRQQFINLINSNAKSNVGTWTESPTNFGSAKVFGTGTNKLTLPATGSRNGTDGKLSNRGMLGSYWSSTQAQNGTSFIMFLSSSNPSAAAVQAYYRLFGSSIRCIEE